MADTHVHIEDSERYIIPGSKAIGRANANATIEILIKLRRKANLPMPTPESVAGVCPGFRHTTWI